MHFAKKLLTKTVFGGIIIKSLADVAELADALDLGSSDFIVGVQVPSSAPPFRTCRIYFCKFFTLADKPTDKSYFACRLVFFGRDSRLPKQFTGLFWLRLVFIRTTNKRLAEFVLQAFVFFFYSYLKFLGEQPILFLKAVEK